jgi:hypothetical protein|tara:strand:+ start:404 stop:1786 length:1383 start_codon:yes stop_codon:yes gene_type:complete
MAFLIGGANSATGGYTIDNSLRINDADDAYLSFTPGSDGDLDKWTLSMWVKRTIISTYDYTFTVADDSGNNTVIVFYNDDGVRFEHYDGSQLGMLTTNRKLKDPSAWYHIVFVWDTGNGTAGNRQRMYINGVEETSFATDTNPSSGRVSFVNDASHEHWIGRGSTQSEANNFDGYLAEVAFCDGQAYAASDFGETDDNGIWIPKKLGVTFGSQGYYLEFKQTGTSQNASGIGADTSGNANHWAVTNLAATDITTDSPTNNFCIANFLDQNGSYALSEGNCQLTSGHTSWYNIGSTMAVANGKWYWEVEFDAGAMIEIMVGIHDTSVNRTGTNAWLTGSTLFYNDSGGEIRTDGSDSTADYGTLTAGDILGIALNMDDKQITLYKNGSAIASNVAISSSISEAMPTFLTDANDVVFKLNFGGSPSFTVSSGNADDNGYGNFEFDVPTGYYALCTKNLAEYG